MTEIAAAFCLFSIFLAPFAVVGLALINTGLGRTRNAAHAMMASLCAAGTAALAYLICGFSWQGVAKTAGSLPYLGNEPWFFRGLKFDGSSSALIALLGMFSAAFVSVIPLATGAERWRLSGICAFSAILAGFVHPVFAHSVWGGGWLAGLGFVDPGGASTIHGMGGLAALAIAWVLGPRRGKFSADGMPSALPGHNSVFILFGSLLALVGWLGMNSAGSLLFGGADLNRLPLVAADTLLSSASAALTAALITRVRFTRPDASLTANGWIGGLVASSAVCTSAPPVAAVLIGAVAGGLVTFSIELLELRLSVDDPGGSISAHGVAAIWGLLAAASFGGQGIAQVVGVLSLVGFVLPTVYGIQRLLDRLVPFRVPPEGERQGLDLHELGSNAYPELVTHLEE